MLKNQDFEVWNLSPNDIVKYGATSIFNIVGRVKNPAELVEFSYILNDKPKTGIFFAKISKRSGRLKKSGDFNIDTINIYDLRRQNLIKFIVRRNKNYIKCYNITFDAVPFTNTEPKFSLDLVNVTAAEQIGQVVEGNWHISRDHSGRKYLEILPEDAGYDRLILFGHREWQSNYEVYTRLSVTKIIGVHNLGIVFRWNPHEQGNGEYLPKTWSTGLAYYTSYGKNPGIRVRYGVNVYIDEYGIKHGDYLLEAKPLSFNNRLIHKFNFLSRLSNWMTDIKINCEYCFRFRIQAKQCALSVWQADEGELSPQIIVNNPIDYLRNGSVGILAFQVALKIHEFRVSPIKEIGQSRD